MTDRTVVLRVVCRSWTKDVGRFVVRRGALVATQLAREIVEPEMRHSARRGQQQDHGQHARPAPHAEEDHLDSE